MFSGGNQKIISGNLQGQALKFPSTIPQGEYKEPQGVLYIPKYMPKKILGHTLCVCHGGYPIYYIYTHDKIPKTHVNHIAGHILA